MTTGAEAFLNRYAKEGTVEIDNTVYEITAEYEEPILTPLIDYPLATKEVAPGTPTDSKSKDSWPPLEAPPVPSSGPKVSLEGFYEPRLRAQGALEAPSEPSSGIEDPLEVPPMPSSGPKGTLENADSKAQTPPDILPGALKTPPVPCAEPKGSHEESQHPAEAQPPRLRVTQGTSSGMEDHPKGTTHDGHAGSRPPSSTQGTSDAELGNQRVPRQPEDTPPARWANDDKTNKEMEHLRLHNASLFNEVEHFRRLAVRQEGYVQALREQLSEWKGQAEHFAECWRTSERRRLVLTESLAGRSLIDALLDELRKAHSSPDELTRRFLLQQCNCDYCTRVFDDLHTCISREVFETFTVKDLRAALVTCYDRFCKVAHPPGLGLHTFETLHDPNLEYTLRALSLRQASRLGGASSWR